MPDDVSAQGVTRREIMRFLPEIGSISNFRNIQRRIKIVRIGERRENHVITYLYDKSVIQQIKSDLKLQKMRRAIWK